MSSAPFSKAKCEQLVELLTNKFKKQFNISFKEKSLLALVNEEVQNLLTSGQAYEKNLVKLEKKLRAAIEADRKRTEADQQNDNCLSENRSIAGDAKSMVSQRSSVVTKGS